MRYITILLLLFTVFSSKGQESRQNPEGMVSYITSQNVYVKFTSTSGIQSGDTLFMMKGSVLTPVLQVKELSSISCVCVPLGSIKLAVNDKITARIRTSTVAKEKPAEEVPPSPTVVKKDSAIAGTAIAVPSRQRIYGRISIASVTNTSNTGMPTDQRMRSTLSLNAQHIGNSNVSAESYISFVNRNKQWDSIRANIFYGLKIYSLSIQYDISPKSSLWVGRKINPRISNVGAIDGVQAEYRFNTLSAGAFSGFRPDVYDYSFNGKLMQYGAYLGHDFSIKKSTFQSTAALVEQKRGGMTDRRFAYLQHANSLTPKLSFFGSAEFDLYKKVQEIKSSSARLTNLYLSFNYRLIRQLSVSFSFSERENIIYYETYKDIVERLLEQETQTGYSLQLRYQPLRKLSAGISASYRDRKSGSATTFYKPSKNLYGYLTYSEVPLLKASATASATVLESSYISGNIYSLGLSKDLLKGKLITGAGYRYADYKLVDSEQRMLQHMAEASILWRIIPKLSLSLNYVGTFEKSQQFSQIYLNLSKSF